MTALREQSPLRVRIQFPPFLNLRCREICAFDREKPACAAFSLRCEQNARWASKSGSSPDRGSSQAIEEMLRQAYEHNLFHSLTHETAQFLY